jgi:hypothetical protein
MNGHSEEASPNSVESSELAIGTASGSILVYSVKTAEESKERNLHSGKVNDVVSVLNKSKKIRVKCCLSFEDLGPRWCFGVQLF